VLDLNVINEIAVGPIHLRSSNEFISRGFGSNQHAMLSALDLLDGGSAEPGGEQTVVAGAFRNHHMRTFCALAHFSSR
jgi:hypothetical protein